MADKHSDAQRVEVFTEVMRAINAADEKNGMECRGFSKGKEPEITMAFVVASGPYARLLISSYEAIRDSVAEFKKERTDAKP